MMLGFFELFDVGGVIKYCMAQVAILGIFLYLKKYIIWAILLFLGLMGMKFMTSILTFFKTLLSSAVGRWFSVIVLCLAVGAVFGWKAHPASAKPKIVHVQKQDEKIRTNAIQWQGKTYYPSSFINAFLKFHKYEGSFASLPMYSIL